MGIIQKQSIQNILILGFGVSIGFVNVLLSPRLLSTEQYGLFQLLISVSILAVQIASLGLPSIISKYLAHYKNANYVGFLRWTTRFAAVCFALFLIVYLSLRTTINNAYQDKSVLFISYFYHVIPLTFFAFVFNILEVIARGFYQSVFSAFLKEPFLKGINLVGLLLFSFQIIDFKWFINLYILGNILMCTFLLLQLHYAKAIPIHKQQSITDNESKTMFRYGFFMFFANIAWIIVNKIDVIFLGQQIGLSGAGVYAYFALWASLIRIPTNAINRISYQIVADSWANNQIEKIKEVYQKTSLIQMIVGVLIFIGIALNKQNIIQLIGTKNGYDGYFNLFYIIGASILIDVTGGLNGQIIMLSQQHKIATWFSISALIICILGNYWGIYFWGIYGAGYALIGTITFYNICNWWYLKYTYKMQPFTIKYLYIIAIGILTFIVFHNLPQIYNTFVDIVIRSSLICIFYGSLILLGKISEDINQLYQQRITQLKPFFNQIWKLNDNKK